MKLYEAIRKGSMRHPQAFGGYFDYHQSGLITGTCALGAALLAVLEEITDKRIMTIQDFSSAMEENGFAEYETAQAISYLFPQEDNDSYTITYWNDELKISREEIADRLEEQSKE